MIDLQDVLNSIAHISHAYRGQIQVLENLREQGERGFLACIDVPDSQLTINPIDATGPMLAQIRQRVNQFASGVVVEAIDAQRYPMPNNSFLHKLFLRVAVREGE
jgi:hypothetical protein